MALPMRAVEIAPVSAVGFMLESLAQLMKNITHG